MICCAGLAVVGHSIFKSRAFNLIPAVLQKRNQCHTSKQQKFFDHVLYFPDRLKILPALDASTWQ